MGLSRCIVVFSISVFFILVAATDIYYETLKILTLSSLESNILSCLVTIKEEQLCKMKRITFVEN
jgi:hypothetical protein